MISLTKLVGSSLLFVKRTPYMVKSLRTSNCRFRSFRLMDFPPLIFPGPIRIIRNRIFAFLIQNYFDNQFSIGGFLIGAKQAVVSVSKLISEGKFNELSELISHEALNEISSNYQKLDNKQRQFISIDAEDIFLKLIYEVGVIMDDNNDRKVEITAIIQGFHGLNEFKDKKGFNFTQQLNSAPDKLFVCNYRFIRSYAKHKEDYWIINKLNHFCPKKDVK